MEYNIEKERYLAKLLGCEFNKVLPNEWIIVDKKSREIGYTMCIEQNNTTSYYTFIDENGIYYDNIRKDDNRSYYIEFGDYNRSIVTMELDGPRKEINIFMNNSVSRLSWKTGDTNPGFSIERIDYTSKANSVNYFKMPERIIVNGKYYPNDLETLMNETNILQRMLIVLDMLIKKLPFDVTLEEIIGEEDIKKSGLKIVFDAMNNKNNKTYSK